MIAFCSLSYPCQDNKDNRHVKTYEVNLKDKELVEGPWLQNNVEMGSSMLIPVPAPLKGVVVVGETVLLYHNGTNFKAIQIPPVSLTQPRSDRVR